mgnify:CR=1 FL=1
MQVHGCGRTLRDPEDEEGSDSDEDEDGEKKKGGDGDGDGIPNFVDQDDDGVDLLAVVIVHDADDLDDALAWWTHVRWLASHPDFFELKRWPRAKRPGRA